jgi:RNA polymerase sigma factor (sigma-70 family)
LHRGSDSAAEEVDRRYRQKLCAFVEREMGKRFAGREDPEDPVQSALASFFRGVEEGRFRIDHSRKLWGLLATITRHKMLKHIEFMEAEMRNPEKEAPLEGDVAASPEPRAEDAVAVADLIEKVIEGLEPPAPEVFRLRLEGLTRKEIAKRVECTEAAVRVKLDWMRDRLRRLLGDHPAGKNRLPG